MKKFQAKTSKLINEVQDIISEYQTLLTVRQIYYRLVAAQIIPNSIKSYKRFDSILSDARKNGLVPFEAITDRTRVPIKASSWESLEDFLETVRHAYRKSKHKNQDNWTEVWLEKDALSGVFEPITRKYDIYLIVGRGYQSLSSLNEASERFLRAGETGKTVRILYFGDYDPTGLDIPRSIQTNFKECFGINPIIERVALTIQDIKDYNLPHAPVKSGDSRSHKFIQTYGNVAVELDALPPDELEKKIEASILKYLDIKQFKKDLKSEKQENDKLAIMIQELEQ